MVTDSQVAVHVSSVLLDSKLGVKLGTEDDEADVPPFWPALTLPVWSTSWSVDGRISAEVPGLSAASKLAYNTCNTRPVPAAFPWGASSPLAASL